MSWDNTTNMARNMNNHSNEGMQHEEHDVPESVPGEHSLSTDSNLLSHLEIGEQYKHSLRS